MLNTIRQMFSLLFLCWRSLSYEQKLSQNSHLVTTTSTTTSPCKNKIKQKLFPSFLFQPVKGERQYPLKLYLNFIIMFDFLQPQQNKKIVKTKK